MSLGMRVRQLRQMRGLTQSQLGGGDLTKSFISLLEKDRTRPSVETLRLIGQRLGTSVDELLGQDGHIPEMIASGLLTLSREAMRRGEKTNSAHLLEFVQWFASTYRLDEAARESQLQSAQLALEDRAFAKAWALVETATTASEQAKDLWRTGRGALVKGWIKLRLREFPDAARWFQKALDMLRRAKAGRDPSRVEALIGLGSAENYMGKYSVAVRHYEEAAHSDVVQHDAVLRGRAMWGVGLAHRKLGNFELAGQFLLKAKDAFESAEELADLMRVLHNLGQLLFYQGRAKDALRYLHQAVRVMDRLEKPVDRPFILSEIGMIHLSVGSLDDAAHFGEEALEAAKTVGDPLAVAEAQLVLARVHSARKEDMTAIDLLKSAVATFFDRQVQSRMVEAAHDLGILLRARGAYAEASDYLALAAQSERKPAPVSAEDLLRR